MNDIANATALSVTERLTTLPPEVQELFTNPENGTPDNISKAGCLALARLGRDAWNGWRKVFPVTGKIRHFKNVADFSGVDFRESPVNFSGFVFGEGADFRHAQWGDGAQFQGAQWGNCAQFQGAQWGESADFEGAQWGFLANFQGAQWGDDAQFPGAQWEVLANFQCVQWGEWANFKGAQWGNWADFQGAQWGSGADFQGASWTACQLYYRDDEHYQAAKKWAEDRGLSPDSFQRVNFAGAHFAGVVDFSNRKFTGHTNFGNLPADFQRKRVQRDKHGQARFDEKGELLWEDDPEPRRHVQFDKAPKFHGCELHQDTTFDGAIFPPASGSDEAARAYRTLKLAFNKQQALREEQLFFKLEMLEEEKKAGATSVLYWLYGFFSDYGFSLWRPVVGYLLLLIIFAYVYGTNSQGAEAMTHCISPLPDCQVQWHWLDLSFAQSLPLTGFDKLKSFETLTEKIPATLLAAHKLLTLACLFFAGLALRNLFRLK